MLDQLPPADAQARVNDAVAVVTSINVATAKALLMGIDVTLEFRIYCSMCILRDGELTREARRRAQPHAAQSGSPPAQERSLARVGARRDDRRLEMLTDATAAATIAVALRLLSLFHKSNLSNRFTRTIAGT
jgi:hypothetical protein